ncbi:MAG TPA: hypothetical protein VKZ83_12295 [Phototrophicaceae bacterium]|nr:hypothetical protein [Phototrophicaceae bacterium]
MAAQDQGRTDGGRGATTDGGRGATPGGRTDGAGRTGQAGRGPERNRNRLGWIAITVAGLLTAWRIVYAITAPSVANTDVYESVDLLLTLVLAVGAVVLGIVALGQRVQPRWPAVAALAVGSYAFVGGVASWIGRLMY